LQTTDITDGGVFALYGIPQTITYGNTVYEKGGQVAHTLRGYMGDSLFFVSIKAYLQKYAYNYASTYDLRDFLSAFSGIDLVPFFDAWVFAPGFPQFSIDSTVIVKSKSGYDITVFARQKLKDRTQYANHNHLEITFIDSSWQKITDSIVFSGATGHKTFHLPSFPLAVMADLDEKISDATTDELKIIKSAGEYDYKQSFLKLQVKQIIDSAMVRVTHNWVAPDSLNVLQPGIRISDSRYWTVEGIIPSGFQAEGEFAYKAVANLDKTLLSDSKDSIVLLYRPGSGQKWKSIPFTRKGMWNEGKLTIEKLQTGEYALGVLNSQNR